jgi:hypothetical protein
VSVPTTQWVPVGQYWAEQLPAQSLAAHEYGEYDSEQQCDQQAALATQPRQNHSPPKDWQDSPFEALHWMPQAPQLASTSVLMALPPQHRAVSSPALQL